MANLTTYSLHVVSPTLNRHWLKQMTDQKALDFLFVSQKDYSSFSHFQVSTRLHSDWFFDKDYLRIFVSRNIVLVYFYSNSNLLRQGCQTSLNFIKTHFLIKGMLALVLKWPEGRMWPAGRIFDIILLLVLIIFFVSRQSFEKIKKPECNHMSCDTKSF